MSAIQKHQTIEIDEQALDRAIQQWNSGNQDLQASFKLAMQGDLSKLSMAEKLGVYVQRCVRMGIDPSTKPFDLIQQYKNQKVGPNKDDWEKVLEKEVLYPNSICAAELRKIHNVSLSHPKTSDVGGMIAVTIEATLPNGRKDADMGIVEPGKYMSRGDAVMKSITKAKRRVTFSILGMPEFTADPGEFEPVTVEVDDNSNDDNSNVENFISEPQRKRLWAITTKLGHDEEFLRALLNSYGIESTKGIPVSQYEEICGELESTPPALE